jgi:hypothetical protein
MDRASMFSTSGRTTGMFGGFDRDAPVCRSHQEYSHILRCFSLVSLVSLVWREHDRKKRRER